ncbi:MAG: carbamoyl phosphate synthase small subunit, partial [Candidatus Marinimicrobia bacterium]|nr:carbamoyl phosphate synthase small subunit [Candidatus Neomarinimicrobiota bacterium]
SLAEWLKAFQIPAITGIDTRTLTQILREEGTMLGKITFDTDIDYFDPNHQHVVAKVSCTEPRLYGKGAKRIAFLDCGCKRSIIRHLSQCNIEIMRLPWNADLSQHDFSGLVISNGPGDPQMCTTTIESARYAIKNNIPTLGICLGNQILALAAGAKTYKLKFGHRGLNQPVKNHENERCYITSQNHGFAVDDSNLPKEFQIWFSNLNDHTNEGLKHKSGRFMGVQFHPEVSPGPMDTTFIFDHFLELL